MHLHLSWHATRQLTLSIGCLAGAITQTGCRPKYMCDHHQGVVGGDDDEAPEIEVAQPERETEAERPSAPGQPYALPRPIVRPLVVEEEPAQVAAAEPEVAEARAEAPTRSHWTRPARQPAAVEVVDAEPSAAPSDAIEVVEPDTAPEAAVAVEAAAQERPRPATTRPSNRSRRADRSGDPAVRSLDHGVAPAGGLGSGSGYGISLTGGIGNY